MGSVGEFQSLGDEKVETVFGVEIGRNEGKLLQVEEP